MTLLGTITTENLHSGPALCVSLCGAHYKGMQITAEGWPNVVLFTDPVSKASIMMSENEVTIGNVWRALRQARARMLDAIRSQHCK